MRGSEISMRTEADISILAQSTEKFSPERLHTTYIGLHLVFFSPSPFSIAPIKYAIDQLIEKGI